MKWLSLRYIRKRWICRRYHICRWHGTLMTARHGAYNLYWSCETCIRENEAKNIHRDRTDHLKRVEMQELLNREWSLPKP